MFWLNYFLCTCFIFREILLFHQCSKKLIKWHQRVFLFWAVLAIFRWTKYLCFSFSSIENGHDLSRLPHKAPRNDRTCSQRSWKSPKILLSSQRVMKFSIGNLSSWVEDKETANCFFVKLMHLFYLTYLLVFKCKNWVPTS